MLWAEPLFENRNRLPERVSRLPVAVLQNMNFPEVVQPDCGVDVSSRGVFLEDSQRAAQYRFGPREIPSLQVHLRQAVHVDGRFGVFRTEYRPVDLNGPEQYLFSFI